LLIWLSAGSVLFALGAGLYSFKRLDASLRALVYFFAIAAGVELTGRVLGMQRLSNVWLINLFMALECVTFINVLAHWRESNNARHVALVVSLAYLGFWFLNLVVFGSLFAVNNYVFTLAAILLIAFSGSTLYHLSGKTTPPLFRNPRFWFAAGILILYCVDATIFSLMEIVTQRGDALLQGTWAIHSVFNIFANMLYAIAFLCSSQPEK
jgi:hypothetical protein